MRIVLVQLTHAEAADATVVRNILSLLEHGDVEIAGTVGLGNGQLPQAPGNTFPPAPQVAGAEAQSTALATNTMTHDQKAAAAFGGAPVPAASTFPAASAGQPMTPPAPPAGQGAPQRDVDSAGWPWDPRIHSEPPTKTDKGIWRASRKAGAAASKPQVEAELRALGYGVVNPPAPPAPTPQPQLTPEQQAALLHAQVQNQGAPAAGFPPPPISAPAPAVGTKRNFEALMMRVQTGVNAKLIGHDWLKQSYVPMGIPNIMTLMQATGDNGTRDAVSELHTLLDTYEIPDHVKG